MWYGIGLFTATGLCFILVVSGCNGSPVPIATLDDLLAGDVGAEVINMEYYVHITLRDGVSKKAAMQMIAKRLTEDCPDLSRPYFPEAGRVNPLRTKDFWAIVLANLAGKELHLYKLDSPENRDRKINQLLSQLG